MKTKLRKFICILILVITIFNIGFPLISSAESPLKNWFPEDYTKLSFLDGTVNFIMAPYKLIPYAIVKVGWGLLSAFATGADDWNVTPEDIIFSGSSKKEGIKFLDINFFDTEKSDDATVNKIRESIAKVYYLMRNIAIVASLVVLIYVGIRMAISSVADTKAKYKEMFKDWLMGFIMLFVLHYIMVATVYINNSLVDLVYTIMGSTQDGFSRVTEDIDDVIVGSGFFRGWGALIVYVAMLGVTVAFFVQYIKRFFTIGFLVAISPLITVTYSIDKMGDGKSQALNTWLKEFIFNIIIQPFHCIIYAMMCSTAVNSLAQTTSLKNFVVAIMSILFVFKAEDIIKNIFGFRAGTLENAAASGALAWGVMSKFQSKSQNKNAKAAGSAGGGSSTSDFKRKGIPQGHTSNPPSGTVDDTKVPSSFGRAKNRLANTAAGQAISNVGRAAASTKVGQAVAKAGQAIGNTAAAEAVSEFAKNRAEELHQFEVDPKAMAKEMAKSAFLKTTNASLKLTPKLMTGAFVSGLTGSAAQGIAAGYITGPGKIGEKFIGPIDKDLHKLQENAYNNRLANADRKSVV